jgi:hypothetical protein
VLKVSIKKSSDVLLKKLSIINGIMDVTPKDLEVLAIMLTDFSDDPAGTLTRKYISAQLGLKNPESINNYVRRLRIAGALLIDSELGYKLNPILLKLRDNDQIQFTFN